MIHDCFFAQASGDLRTDFRATDVKMIAFMLASIAEYAAAVTPEVWRRYLTMLIDGLRPARDGQHGLRSGHRQRGQAIDAHALHQRRSLAAGRG